MVIFLFGAIIVYIIGFHPNNSEYINTLLYELNSIFIGGIFTILIVDRASEWSIKRQKRKTMNIMKISIGKFISMIIREFHYKIIRFAKEVYSKLIKDTEVLDKLIELYDNYVSEDDIKEKENFYLLYLFELNNALKNNSEDVIPAYKDSSEFYKLINEFYESIKVHFNSFRMNWVQRFLVFVSDEYDLVNKIMDLDSKIYEFERLLSIYLKNDYNILSEEEYNKLSKEEQEEIKESFLSDEENEMIFKEEIIISKGYIYNSLQEVIEAILQLTITLYQDK